MQWGGRRILAATLGQLLRNGTADSEGRASVASRPAYKVVSRKYLANWMWVFKHLDTWIQHPHRGA